AVDNAFTKSSGSMRFTSGYALAAKFWSFSSTSRGAFRLLSPELRMYAPVERRNGRCESLMRRVCPCCILDKHEQVGPAVVKASRRDVYGASGLVEVRFPAGLVPSRRLSVVLSWVSSPTA